MDVVIHIQGMSCGHCKKKIEDAVNEFNGVNHVEVHLQNDTVNLDYNQEKVTLEEICDAIENQGYEVDR